MTKYENPPHNQIPGWSDILEEYIGFKTDGYFVEVGAFDGVWWSPSRTLAVAGWSGIFFEPQTRVWMKLRENYKDSSDRITCVKKAISDFEGTAALYLGGSTSTLSEDTRETYLTVPELSATGLSSGKKEFVDVSMLDVELVTFGAPIGFDVLVIDVEGSELSVLRGFNIELWAPRLVVIEAYEYHKSLGLRERAPLINEHMLTAGYEKIHSDHINNIYIKEG